MLEIIEKYCQNDTNGNFLFDIDTDTETFLEVIYYEKKNHVLIYLWCNENNDDNTIFLKKFNDKLELELLFKSLS